MARAVYKRDRPLLSSESQVLIDRSDHKGEFRSNGGKHLDLPDHKFKFWITLTSIVCFGDLSQVSTSLLRNVIKMRVFCALLVIFALCSAASGE